MTANDTNRRTAGTRKDDAKRQCRSLSVRAMLVVYAVISGIVPAGAFCPIRHKHSRASSRLRTENSWNAQPSGRSRSVVLRYRKNDHGGAWNDGHSYGDSDRSRSGRNDSDAVLTERIRNLRLQIMEEEYRRPPSADLTPKELVRQVVMGLYHAYDPTPDAGFRLLLQSSTKDWRSEIVRSVGAKDDSDLSVVASALGSALERPNNQYSILVGEAEDFRLDFPSELNFEDGTCWIECRLRDRNDRHLLVITGWDLVQEDGVWLVDRVLWQDFRDDYRPGVGREEWMMLVD